jgi:4-hydroxymandelate oxidase
MSGRITRRQSLLSGAGLAVAGMIPSRVDSASAATEPSLELEDAFTLSEIESLARKRMPQGAYDWISGGGGDGKTVQWNRKAYGRIRLRPRVLVDVSKIDTGIKLLGQEMPFPILLAPTGGHKLFHPEGELATVRGAGAASATVVMSSASTFPIADIVRAATRPVWLQLFIKPDRALTQDLVQRAEDAGCSALCVTVDDPVTGVRDWTRRSQGALPHVERPNPGASSAKFEPRGDRYTPVMPDKVTWEGIDWLRSFARVPVLLKGILNPDDADHAVQVGVSGLIVSNHGGRQLDTVPATIDALPLVVARVAGRVPVLVDGGIRRGTDVLKGLALGASAVLIGRPYLYGLTVGGAPGVTRVINLLRAELENAMALAGRPSIQSIDRSALWES